MAQVEAEDPFKSRVLNSSHEAFMMNNTSAAMNAKISDIEESKNQSSGNLTHKLELSAEEDKEATYNLKLELNKEEHK